MPQMLQDARMQSDFACDSGAGNAQVLGAMRVAAGNAGRELIAHLGATNACAELEPPEQELSEQLRSIDGSELPGAKLKAAA